jgi:hypothetical protein
MTRAEKQAVIDVLGSGIWSKQMVQYVVRFVLQRSPTNEDYLAIGYDWPDDETTEAKPGTIGNIQRQS